MEQKTTLPDYEAQKRQRQWWLMDASGVPLGRLAVRAARLLSGKHKPIYTPFWDLGDAVIIINASRVKLTGLKAKQKFYRRHSGFPGGLTAIPFGEMLKKKPETLVRKVVSGMLPKNRLGKRMIRRLNIYRDVDHPHTAQNPVPVDLKGTPASAGKGYKTERPKGGRE